MGNNELTKEKDDRLSEAELRKKVEALLKEDGLMDKILEENAPYFKLMQSCPETRKKYDRNAPCPCGSGKKYKKCCIKYESETMTREELQKKLDEMGFTG